MLIGLQNGTTFYETVTGTHIKNPTGELAIGFGADTEVSALALARAYTIFGSNGALMQPNAVDEVYLDGRPIEFNRKPALPVIDGGAAYITTQLMRSVLGYGFDGRYGTGRAAFEKTGLSADKIEIAGKTGSGPYSVWMVSVSPRVVVAVLLAYQCHSEIKNAREMFSKDTAASYGRTLLAQCKDIGPICFLVRSTDRETLLPRVLILPAAVASTVQKYRRVFSRWYRARPCTTR